jgi:hypothetical protein
MSVPVFAKKRRKSSAFVLCSQAVNRNKEGYPFPEIGSFSILGKT